MENHLQVSLAQISLVPEDEEANFAKAVAWTEEAARRGSELVVFPETWSSGGVTPASLAKADPLGEGIFLRISALAKRCAIHIVGSNLANLGEGRYGNVCTHYAPDGSLLGAYTKIHLFRPMAEHEFLVSGDGLTLLDTPWGKTGLAVCYDLRFPEVFRTYALNGAGVIILPSAWPHPRQPAWQVLLQARAIENQCFLLGCNRVGKDGRTEYFGSSAAVDPWGRVLVQANECEALLTVSLALDSIEEARRKIPVFEDRKPSAYVLPEQET